MVTRMPSPANGRVTTPGAQVHIDPVGPVAEFQIHEVGLRRKELPAGRLEGRYDSLALTDDHIDLSWYSARCRMAASAPACATRLTANGSNVLSTSVTTAGSATR